MYTSNLKVYHIHCQKWLMVLIHKNTHQHRWSKKMEAVGKIPNNS